MARITGGIQEMLNAAIEIGLGNYDHAPMSPVIRMYPGEWVLESEINDPEGSLFTVSIETFLSYADGNTVLEEADADNLACEMLSETQFDEDMDEGDIRERLYIHLKKGGTLDNFQW